MVWWGKRPALAAVLVSLAAAAGSAEADSGGARSPAMVTARAAVLMDRASGSLVYARNPDLPLPPASTTKVMTAVLALESGRLGESFSVSRYAASMAPSKINVVPGTHLRLHDLTYAVLLNSANDASVVVAEGLGDSVDGFAGRMNRRAAELGARNTHFVNPNGLPAEGHYSSARDLALIVRHALGVPGFREIAGTEQTRITVGGGARARTVALRNHNRLLHGYRVPVIGKTGYTRAARRCFVGAAAAGDREIIVAVLGSTDLWDDVRQLLDFGLSPDAPAPVEMEMASTAPAEVRPEAVGAEGDLDTRPLALRPPAGPAAAPGYSVVVGLAQSRAAAERLRHFVARRGYRAVVEPLGREAARRYRVRLVGFADGAAAERAAARLRAEHLQAVVVVPGEPERAAAR